MSQRVWGTQSPSGVQGQSPGMRSGDRVPQKLKHFCKYKPSNLRPRENYFNNNINNNIMIIIVTFGRPRIFTKTLQTNWTEWTQHFTHN